MFPPRHFCVQQKISCSKEILDTFPTTSEARRESKLQHSDRIVKQTHSWRLALNRVTTLRLAMDHGKEEINSLQKYDVCQTLLPGEAVVSLPSIAS